MKKIILTLAAIFIATQLFSQTNKNNISINDITKIFITYETYNKYKINDSVNGLDLIKNKSLFSFDDSLTPPTTRAPSSHFRKNLWINSGGS